MLLLLLMTLSLEGDAKPFTEGKEKLEGFYTLYWDDASGELFLALDRFDEPFIFVNGLATGLGSNDIGLDRGQLGGTRIVHFHRVGKQVFLIEPNLTYRAPSDNPMEVKAVSDSFASSTLWGTTIVAEEDGVAFVNLSTLVFRDEHGISQRLKRSGEGSYSLDKSRAFYYKPRTKSFPDNSEIEVSLTWRGQPTGPYVYTVTPTPDTITLRQHFSMVRLPDDNFKPRPFHPRSGAFPMRFRDYAAPLDADLDVLLTPRHRLVRKKPNAKRSELVEPLVYYVDSGAPELIKQALIDGAMWWNDAFEAAGIINGFRVEELPPDADPMDVRYNTIQWVHRSTRGWSYGASVMDPRTGEIIKGHVTLGSLRVRQDRLLFEGMIPFDENGESTAPDGMKPVDLALARIRQLSAHEVGHTIGIAHNFASSNLDRASVMDYPAPLVTLKDGKLDFSAVYDVGIGEWDKLAVRYSYGEWKDEAKGLAEVIQEAKDRGIRYITDADSRSTSAMHTTSHLWDNGQDGLDEYARVVELRAHLLANFSHRNLRPNTFTARLEEVLVPVYLHHRFQLDAMAKSIGGRDYDYFDNNGVDKPSVTPAERQRLALKMIMDSLKPEFLDLPEHLRGVIPPRPPGYGRHRELFDSRTSPEFDEMALVETGAAMVLTNLLDPMRLNRVHGQWATDAEQLSPAEVISELLRHSFLSEARQGRVGAVQRQVNFVVLDHLVKLMGDARLREEVRAEVFAAIKSLGDAPDPEDFSDSAWVNHYKYIAERAERAVDDDAPIKSATPLKRPPGSPIGSDPHDHN